MRFESILGYEKYTVEKGAMPDFFLDLNIDQLFKMIQDQVPGYDITQMYYHFPKNAQEEAYRRCVYQDVKNPEIYASLENFSKRMRKFSKALASREEVESHLQICAWHVTAAYTYAKAVDDLHQDLNRLPVKSDGLIGLKGYLNEYVRQKEYITLKEISYQIQNQLDNMRLILEIENNKITVTEGTLEGEYEKFLGSSLSKNRSPFMSMLRMSELEEELFGIFRKKYPTLFDAIEKFPKEFPQFGEEMIFTLEKELQYYIAFYRFQKKLEGWGYFLSTPERNENKAMEANCLYDLALACSNYVRGMEVVSNDFVYQDGELFFVVNGPNQGGKTTFARSLGQLVFFTKMGFDVPASWSNVHYFNALLTHFSVEESMETGQGKLMEELHRLAPMMKQNAKNAFVILNELFTTAAHYDGCVMGAKVLDHFMKSQSRGIYVTHLKELGDSVEGVVPLTAMLDGSKEHRRTYKILRSKIEEAGYAEDIVKKYQLTYEQLKERLQG